MDAPIEGQQELKPVIKRIIAHIISCDDIDFRRVRHQGTRMLAHLRQTAARRMDCHKAFLVSTMNELAAAQSGEGFAVASAALAGTHR
jgi:hypothetical protein